MNYQEYPIIITGCARSSGVYEIKNIIANKRYIGSAVNLKERFRLHKLHLRLGTHKNRYLQNAWNKYGIDAFRFRCLLYCDRKHLFFYEQRFLDICKDLYNLSPNAGTTLGIKHSKAFCKKISKSQKGRVPWNKGLTKETDLRVRANADSLKGKIKSKLLRQKIREALIGYRHTKKAKLNMSMAQREKAWGPKSSLRRKQAKLRGKTRKRILVLKNAREKLWSSPNNRKKASLRTQKRVRDKKGRFIKGGVYVR